MQKLELANQWQLPMPAFHLNCNKLRFDEHVQTPETFQLYIFFSALLQVHFDSPNYISKHPPPHFHSSRQWDHLFTKFHSILCIRQWPEV